MKKTGIGISWKPLEWDSRQLGIRAARITIDDKESPAEKPGRLRSLVKELKKKKINYAMCRLDITRWKTLQQLIEENFLPVDIILTWEMDLSGFKNKPVKSPAHIREFRPQDLARITKLANSSFRFDRYHNDPAIDPVKADALHAEWLRNACNGFADKVFIAEKNNVPAGFISVKFNSDDGISTGVIDLVAVDSRCRRQNIGMKLVAHSLSYMKTKARRARVGTQMTNAPAWRLYQRAGFCLRDASITLRLWQGS